MGAPRQYRGGDFQKVNTMLQGNNKIIYAKLITKFIQSLVYGLELLLKIHYIYIYKH